MAIHLPAYASSLFATKDKMNEKTLIKLKKEIKNLNDYVRCRRIDIQFRFFRRLIEQLDLINSILEK